MDYSGLETYRSNLWQNNCIFLKFHFITSSTASHNWAPSECGCNSGKTNKGAGQLLQGPGTGGTQTLPCLYEAAGLQFDFSPERIKVLMEFVKVKWNDHRQSSQTPLITRSACRCWYPWQFYFWNSYVLKADRFVAYIANEMDMIIVVMPCLAIILHKAYKIELSVVGML